MADTAYRGYIIRVTVHGIFVIKDGVTICRPNTVEDAKRQIDEVVG